MLEEPIKEGVPPKMKGSVLMCVADTEEEVWDRVKKDVYYTGDVWDKEKVSAVVLGGATYWETLGGLFGSLDEYAADTVDRFRFSRSRARSGRVCERSIKSKNKCFSPAAPAPDTSRVEVAYNKSARPRHHAGI